MLLPPSHMFLLLAHLQIMTHRCQQLPWQEGTLWVIPLHFCNKQRHHVLWILDHHRRAHMQNRVGLLEHIVPSSETLSLTRPLCWCIIAPSRILDSTHEELL